MINAGPRAPIGKRKYPGKKRSANAKAANTKAADTNNTPGSESPLILRSVKQAARIIVENPMILSARRNAPMPLAGAARRRVSKRRRDTND